MFWQKISAKNKAVIITGCDSGFGNALAFRLNSMGFRVYACVLDTNSTGAQDLSNKCQFKDEICIVRMDVTIDEDINRCHEFVVADLQTSNRVLWSVVNNAGVLTYGHLEWGAFDDFVKVYDVNVFGVVRVTRKFIPLIRETKGRLVIVASMGGRLASDNLSAYCSSKAAIISVATVLRREMAKFGVRVSTIEPAFFKTGVYYAVIPSFEHNWANTPDPIRQVYGNQYFADQLAALKRRRRLSFGSKNLGTVVDAMVDAVRSRSPNKTYSPVNVWPFKVVPLVLPYIPQWVLDLGFRELDSTKPAFVSQKAK